jgi:hypothetical protein
MKNRNKGHSPGRVSGRGAKPGNFTIQGYRHGSTFDETCIQKKFIV